MRRRKKEFKRSRKTKRVRFAMPRVNEVSYSSDSTPVETPTVASVQHDAEAESTADEETEHIADKDIVIETSLNKEEDSEPVEEILALGPSL